MSGKHLIMSFSVVDHVEANRKSCVARCWPAVDQSAVAYIVTIFVDQVLVTCSPCRGQLFFFSFSDQLFCRAVSFFITMLWPVILPYRGQMLTTSWSVVHHALVNTTNIIVPSELYKLIQVSVMENKQIKKMGVSDQLTNQSLRLFYLNSI